MTEHQPLQGAFWMVAAGAMFAIINTALQYLGINYGLGSGAAVLFQYGIALILFLPMMRTGAIRSAVSSDFRLLHILRVGVSVIGIQLWTWALAYPVPIWQGIALLMVSPLFATIGSGLLLRESVSAARWIATLVGFLGALLVLQPWSDAFQWASLMPVAAAFFWASASLLTKFTVSRDTPTTIVFYLLVLMLPFNLMFGLPTLSLPSDGSVWGLLLLIGALTAFAQWAVAKAYSVADASFVQPFDHLKLPLNVLAGFLVFGWVPPGMLWLGSALIIASVVFVTHYERRRNPVAVLWEETHKQKDA
ncbi:DMT family transporter [Psychrobacter sp. FDAARGOS_221]|uniref:DMT family transporter n=1 Tax=Psychrobacter sp. FDAARGOS_221 TaxID=1975705 RepID=UPI000BB57882|nr:DMT family transporter [Psychrobacter sp. FDAARGOS_221]PNK61069.1 EamA/RhaT family transporter [Psychrobacter sp. FDAARGOS_221]